MDRNHQFNSTQVYNSSTLCMGHVQYYTMNPNNVYLDLLCFFNERNLPVVDIN